jgi:peptide/nickel transport system substrate-binding protein
MKNTKNVIISLFIVTLFGLTACGQTQKDDAVSEKLVFAAEYQPDCADILGSCAIDINATWQFKALTIPSAFELGSNGEYQPTLLLEGEPVTESVNGKFIVNYKINPEAKWNDGKPITAQDFIYTWKEITTGEDILDTLGYEDIENIEIVSEKEARVIFSKPYPAYKEVFAGFYGVLPSHILEGKNRQKIMERGYKFSGGPYQMKEWKTDESLTFEANPNWWGKKSDVKEFTFKYIEDEKAQLNSISKEDIVAAYLTSGESYEIPSVAKEIKGKDLAFEALNFNAESIPEVEVRQALAYSVDREEVSKTVLGKSDVYNTIIPLNKDYSEFGQYKFNVKKAKELMQGAGYKQKDKVWHKDGKKLSLVFSTTSGDSVRDNETVVLLRGWKEAGFDIKVKNADPDALFDKVQPEGEFDITLSAIYTTADIGLCSSFCSTTLAPEGPNISRYTTSRLDELLVAAEQEVDRNVRKDIIKQAAEIIATDVPVLPLFQPNVSFVYNKNISNVTYTDPISGPWANVHLWEIK